MLFGNGHFAVQVVFVHQQQHLGQHLALIVRHAVDILAQPRENRQIGHGPQIEILAESAHQPADVFAYVGPAQSQNQRFVRMHEKAFKLLGDRRLREADIFGLFVLLGQLVVIGEKALHIDAGRDHPVGRHRLVLI